MNLHIDLYNKFKEQLDSEIINLLAVRQNIKLNSKIFKVFELGGINTEYKLVSKIDSDIYDIETTELSFNPPLHNPRRITLKLAPKFPYSIAILLAKPSKAFFVAE